MQIKSIIREIQQLPLDEKFVIIEQTLKSIKKEELKQYQKLDSESNEDGTVKNKKFNVYSVSEKSLASDWLSEEDNRWDNLL